MKIFMKIFRSDCFVRYRCGLNDNIFLYSYKCRGAQITEEVICEAIKQNESEVASNMLLVSEVSIM